MKNEKTGIPQSKQEKSISQKSSTGNSKKGNNGVRNGDTLTSATEKTKAKSGRGLANEGTVVSYDEER